jgi:hypothetical protein
MGMHTHCNDCYARMSRLPTVHAPSRDEIQVEVWEEEAWPQRHTHAHALVPIARSWPSPRPSSRRVCRPYPLSSSSLAVVVADREIAPARSARSARSALASTGLWASAGFALASLVLVLGFGLPQSAEAARETARATVFTAQRGAPLAAPSPGVVLGASAPSIVTLAPAVTDPPAASAPSAETFAPAAAVAAAPLRKKPAPVLRAARRPVVVPRANATTAAKEEVAALATLDQARQETSLVP